MSLRYVVFCVAALIVALGALTSIAGGQNCDFNFQCCLQHRANDNHYDEYTLKSVPFTAVGLKLFDQFLMSPATYALSAPAAIWAPASKIADSPYDGEAATTSNLPSNENLFYVRYPIKLKGDLKLPYESRKDVFVFTEFGPLVMKISVPQFLVAPAFNYRAMEDVPGDVSLPRGYNNYLCYSAMPSNFMDARDEPIELSDAFSIGQAKSHTVSSRFLCVPTEIMLTEKNACQPIEDADLSYLCYGLAERLATNDATRYVRDAFFSSYGVPTKTPSGQDPVAQLSIDPTGDNLVCAPARVLQSYVNAAYSSRHRDTETLCRASPSS
jgi:hypothetical protein